MKLKLVTMQTPHSRTSQLPNNWRCRCNYLNFDTAM